MRAGDPASADAVSRVTRLVLEKPIGRDAPSSDALLRAVAEHAHPDATLIVDHYLAKPGLWLVASVAERLTAAAGGAREWVPAQAEAAILEAELLDARTTFFSRYGITRDVMQSHLTQVVAAAAVGLAAGSAALPPGVAAPRKPTVPPAASRLAALRNLTAPRLGGSGGSSLVGFYRGYEELAASEAAPNAAPPLAATAARHTLVLGRGADAPPLPVRVYAGKALGVRSCFLRLRLDGTAGAPAPATTVSVHVQGTLLPPPGISLAGLRLPGEGIPAVLIVQEAGARGPGPEELARAILTDPYPGAGDDYSPYALDMLREEGALPARPPLRHTPWPWSWEFQEARGSGGPGSPTVLLATPQVCGFARGGGAVALDTSPLGPSPHCRWWRGFPVSAPRSRLRVRTSRPMRTSLKQRRPPQLRLPQPLPHASPC